MDRAPLESKLEQAASLAAVDLGILTLKLNVVGRRGWPDRIFLYKGNALFIELKRPGEKPTPIQEWVHEQLRKQGFTVMVMTEAPVVRTFLKEWKHVCDRRQLEAAGGYSHHD